MNRIEEIKERLRLRVDTEESHYTDDISYLLSLNERYREALRKISVTMPGSRDNELVLYYERIAKEALEE